MRPALEGRMQQKNGANKRRKEIARQERQREKEANRVDRKKEKSDRSAGGEDPDLAGIVAGPQAPLAE